MRAGTFKVPSVMMTSGRGGEEGRREAGVFMQQGLKTSGARTRPTYPERLRSERGNIRKMYFRCRLIDYYVGTSILVHILTQTHEKKYVDKQIFLT